MSQRIKAFLSLNANRSGCWEWQGWRDKDGYCHTKVNGRTTIAHRAVYAFVKGPIPDGLNLMHRCDNPSCCNPEHLFPGTQKQNCEDAKAKDRHSRGDRNGIAKFTDDQIRYIRQSPKTQWEIAKEFGVWQGTISSIKRRTRWVHVQD